MQDQAKYTIRARLTANGVIERSDVVGAIFGQTEGLLGDDLDLRELQRSDRVGRIDVDVSSHTGTSSGNLTIKTDLDRAETAVLAAALETIAQIGPCRATIDIDHIEDSRAAKRRRIADRASELLATGFEDVGLAGRDLVNVVRERATPADIDEYAGYPAGPDLGASDEIVIVEGRADVRRLIECGFTNVVGVEGTDVPREIADLTTERTVTAFFDGDRGGNLLLIELARKGDVDFVTFAPPGQSVEDLPMASIREALAQRVPYEHVQSDMDAGEEPLPMRSEPDEDAAESVGAVPDIGPAVLTHAREVVRDKSGTVRVLEADWSVLTTGDPHDLSDLLASVGGDIAAVVIDAVVDQQEADIAARFGVPMVIGRSAGEFTKRSADVRILSADRLLNRKEKPEQAS